MRERTTILSKGHRASVLMALAVGTLSLGCASTRADQATTATMTNNGFDKNPHPGANNVNAEIQALMRTYQRSLNEADVALVRSVYADDAIFIGQPFPTATGIDAIAALYADFLSKMDFDVEFEILEVELGDTVGFVRTQSLGTIVPKGQTPAAKERNREVFVVKKIEGAWKFYRYIFNSEV